MSAEFEEVVVDADAFDAQHLRPDLRQRRLGLRARRHIVGRRAAVRDRQGLAVHLAIRAQRQGLQHHDHARRHIVRQTTLQPRPKPGRLQRLSLRRHHIGHQPPVPRRILTHDRHRLGHRRLIHQRRLDLSQLDAEAPQLHLMVDPAQELQLPVRAPANPVARPVHPLARFAERTRHEPLRRQTRTVQITPRKTMTRYVKLARNTHRNRLKLSIKNINPRVRDRTTNRNAS